MQKKTRMDKQQKIQEVTDKLGPLYKEKELLEKKIIRLFNQRKKLKNDLSIDFSANIPSDLSKITKEQWKWILYGGHDETESQYNFLGKIIKAFYRNGFRYRRNEFIIKYSPTGNRPKNYKV